MWAIGQAVMTYALIAANMKLLSKQYAWNWMQLLVLCLSIVTWWPSAYLASSTAVTENQFTYVMTQGQLGVFVYLQQLPAFWLCGLLLLGMFVACDMARSYIPRLFQSNLYAEVLTA